jgi:hypothetical protein
VLRNVTVTADKVTECPETLPPEILPEYRECYDFALVEFLNKGHSPELADQEAREAVKEFVAQSMAGASEEIDF